MDNASKPERPGERRAADRRNREHTYLGGDKRVAARRAGTDRRASPRD